MDLGEGLRLRRSVFPIGSTFVTDGPDHPDHPTSSVDVDAQAGSQYGSTAASPTGASRQWNTCQ